MYYWCADIPQKWVQHELRINSDQTMVDWYNSFREICVRWNDMNAQELGGFDVNGYGIVVEIDESKYFHRKYHRGQ